MGSDQTVVHSCQVVLCLLQWVFVVVTSAVV